MKYFQHDTNARTNRKVRKVIRTHGPTGLAIWWSLLEEMYQADEEGFQIAADNMWLESFAESMAISDQRTIVRILDTFSEAGLINSQMWADGILYIDAIAERGDRYVKKKAQNAKRQAKYREKRNAESTEELEKSRVSNALLTRESQEVTLPDPDTDPDTDPDRDPPLTPPQNFGQVGPCHAEGDPIARSTTDRPEPNPIARSTTDRPAENQLPVSGSADRLQDRQEVTPTGLGENSAAANFLDERNNPPWRDEAWNYDSRMIQAVADSATGSGGAAAFKLPNGRPNARNIKRHLRKLDREALQAGYSRGCEATLELLDYWDMVVAVQSQPERTSDHPAGVIFTPPLPAEEAATPEQIAAILKQARAIAANSSTSRRSYAKRR